MPNGADGAGRVGRAGRAEGPRAAGRAGKPAGAGELDKGAPARRPARPASRALRVLLGEVGAAKATLQEATDALRSIDARVRSWDRAEAFLERRAHALHDEATARFAQSLDALHPLVIRLLDSSAGPAFSSRLRAAGSLRLQAQVRSELRGLQRAFQGGGALLSRSLEAFEV